jgi:hypothetical protein
MATYFSDRLVEYPGRYLLTDSAGTSTQYTLTRDEGEVTDEGTELTADNLEAGIKAVVSAGLTDGSISLSELIQCGAVVAKTKGNAKETVTVDVSFGTTFPTTPIVVATPYSSVPHTVDISVKGVTTTGCTIYVYRSTSGANTVVNWIAMAI